MSTRSDSHETRVLRGLEILCRTQQESHPARFAEFAKHRKADASGFHERSFGEVEIGRGDVLQAGLEDFRIRLQPQLEDIGAAVGEHGAINEARPDPDQSTVVGWKSSFGDADR